MTWSKRYDVGEYVGGGRIKVLTAIEADNPDEANAKARELYPAVEHLIVRRSVA